MHTIAASTHATYFIIIIIFIVVIVVVIVIIIIIIVVVVVVVALGHPHARLECLLLLRETSHRRLLHVW
jgi:hypothetical protein